MSHLSILGRENLRVGLPLSRETHITFTCHRVLLSVLFAFININTWNFKIHSQNLATTPHNPTVPDTTLYGREDNTAHMSSDISYFHATLLHFFLQIIAHLQHNQNIKSNFNVFDKYCVNITLVSTFH